MRLVSGTDLDGGVDLGNTGLKARPHTRPSRCHDGAVETTPGTRSGVLRVAKRPASASGVRT